MSQVQLPDRDFSVGFFDDEPTKIAIDAVGKADTLTLFLGAGVPSDLGIPNWSALVGNLLDSLIVASNDDVGSVSEATLDYYRLMPTASIVDELFRDQTAESGRSRQDDPVHVRNVAIRNLIYPPGGIFDRRALPTGSLLRYVLRLVQVKKLNGCDVRIITTNYDEAAETFARRDRRLRFSNRRIIVERRAAEIDEPLPPNVIPVYHPHGTITRRGKIDDADIVFSERQYIKWALTPWPEHLAARFAADGVVLFLGTSLRDYNIAGIIRRSAIVDGKGRRIAVLPIQDEYQNAVKRGVDLPQELLKYANRRGRHLGCEILRPNFYGQVSQLLHEMTLASDPRTSRVATYSDRLQEWFRDWNQRQISTIAGFEAAALSLRQLADDAKAAADQFVPNLIRFAKAEVWVRSEPGILELWHSSQSIGVRSAGHYRRHDAEIGIGSKYAAIDVFAARFPTFGTINHRADERWSHFFGVPVVLDSRPRYELPVGVVLLLISTHRPIDDEQDPDQKRDRELLLSALESIADAMQGRGKEFLSP